MLARCCHHLRAWHLLLPGRARTQQASDVLCPARSGSGLVQADATCPNEVVISFLHVVLEHFLPSLLPVAAATPDLLHQLAVLAGLPGQLGSLLPELNRPVRPAD